LGWEERLDPAASSDFMSVGDEEEGEVEELLGVGERQGVVEEGAVTKGRGVGFLDGFKGSSGQGLDQEEQYKDCDDDDIGNEQQQDSLQQQQDAEQEEKGGEGDTPGYCPGRNKHQQQQEQQQQLSAHGRSSRAAASKAAGGSSSSSHCSSSSSTDYGDGAAVVPDPDDGGSVSDDSSTALVPLGVDEPWSGHYLIHYPDRVINSPQLQVRGGGKRSWEVVLGSFFSYYNISLRWQGRPQAHAWLGRE
jgi:hypothetical protein